jgi:hypothetical protein
LCSNINLEYVTQREHYDNTNQNRLVIHTRQLSNGVSYEMIDKMAQIIKDHLDHLKELGLI